MKKNLCLRNQQKGDLYFGGWGGDIEQKDTCESIHRSSVKWTVLFCMLRF